ncbi:MAG: PD-(D/E)XK nuclease family protein [Nodosilinea sp.]
MALFRQLLRLHKGNIPLEDFFTEIVAYFLSENKDILLTWLKYSHILESGDCIGADLATQKTYKHPVTGDEKRPDVVIELSNKSGYDLIFIESKVGSSEGYNQLSAYAEILESLPGYQQKFLIYITRRFDPKEKTKVFKNISEPTVKFRQLRWHKFYQFLTSQENSELKQEIILFMQEYYMAKSNQFSSADILALMTFPLALDLMKQVMWGKVLHKFEDVLGEHKPLGFRKRRALQTIEWHGRYIIISGMPDKWACFIGFFMKSSIPSDYPTIRLVLEVAPNSPKRKEIIEEMRKISNQFNWKSNSLDVPGSWASISLDKSLKDFISLDDHVYEIEEFFLNALKELEQVRQQYPQLPWGTVSDEDEEVLENDA